MLTIKEIIKLPVMAVLSHAKAGVLYYEIDYKGTVITIPIDMNDREDVGDTTFINEYKPITLMRYIRKAIENGTLVETHYALDNEIS